MMTQYSPEMIITNSTTPRFRDAFVRLTNDIRAVPEEQYLQINVDVASSVTTILGAWPEIRNMRAELLQYMPNFDIAILDHLESYALALGHAQTLYQTATAPSASLIALGTETEKVREVFLAEIKMQMARGLIDAAATKDLKGVNGYKNVAFDVFALSNILRNNWTKIAGRTSVTTDELDAAEVLADKLVTAVGEREQAPTTAAEAVRDRQGAYTLLMNAYDEVRWAIGYLRRKEGDIEDIAPSLYLGRGSGKKKEEKNPQPIAPTAPTAPTTTTTTTQPVTSGSTTAGATGTAQKEPPNPSATGPYMQ
ncbi:MAG TPA: hypothetical protein VIV60_18520 [Polyangiaceae bacterium]